ncbi:serine/threonine protein kinase [Lysinibacillus contaminans]|uniref:non-specific serine/threonine protein kinase n=1 Tax=Lysinibacillus contaminans TaxID=1293441 RepID=A0ABR5K3L0_9BACI|nr:Stk1 family PASTA domain-containing Ser/Thr kinase [Lysinibacillus contaminans]KOS69517.1 serine/threonine protein kinase [Lysinibacillus contaminans]
MLVGKRISDRYKIIELIGGGGMSNVYLAHDVILNRDVAIKILRYDFTNEDELHRRFQREALSVTSLTHPNIVSIYDVGDDGDLHYIVMEYVKGKTLKQYIQEFAPISPARSVLIMRQLTSAIADAHANHIIHRDIKPQNILMDGEGNVKITDFGIAITLSSTSFTQTNSVLGTVHYLSPEQARGGTATSQSDIYALGIVLYELLTGELPFSGESAVSIALKHLQTETPSIRAFDATIPQSLENVVLKATAKDPAHRYATVEALQADLDTVLSPTRINEKKFAVPIDNNATRVMPIIKEQPSQEEEDLTETRAMEPILQSAPNKSVKKPVKKPVKKSAPDKKKKKWPKIVAGVLAAIVIVFLYLFLATDVFSPKKITVPDVTGETIEAATEKLEALGFIVGKTIEQHSEEIEEGKVIETDPEKDTERVKGTEIDLIVSLGIEKYKMLNHKGQQLDQVKALLADKEFLAIEEEYEHSDEPAGTIIGQIPAVDEEIVPKETTIVFTVSSGKNYITVKDVRGYTEAQVVSYVNSVGLKYVVEREDHSSTVSAGSVISQTPTGGNKLEAGDTISVVLSKGPAKKPDKTYSIFVTIPYEPSEEGMEQLIRIEVRDKTHTMAKPYDEFKISKDTPYEISFVVGEGEEAAYIIYRDSEIIEQGTKHYDEIKQGGI